MDTYFDLGGHSFPVTTQSTEARTWFWFGLTRLLGGAALIVQTQLNCGSYSWVSMCNPNHPQPLGRFV